MLITFLDMSFLLVCIRHIDSCGLFSEVCATCNNREKSKHMSDSVTNKIGTDDLSFTLTYARDGLLL